MTLNMLTSYFDLNDMDEPIKQELYEPLEINLNS
jgi:hypothetical protein